MSKATDTSKLITKGIDVINNNKPTLSTIVDNSKNKVPADGLYVNGDKIKDNIVNFRENGECLGGDIKAMVLEGKYEQSINRYPFRIRLDVGGRCKHILDYQVISTTNKSDIDSGIDPKDFRHHDKVLTEVLIGSESEVFEEKLVEDLAVGDRIKFEMRETASREIWECDGHIAKIVSKRFSKKRHRVLSKFRMSYKRNSKLRTIVICDYQVMNIGGGERLDSFLPFKVISQHNIRYSTPDRAVAKVSEPIQEQIPLKEMVEVKSIKPKSIKLAKPKKPFAIHTSVNYSVVVDNEIKNYSGIIVAKLEFGDAEYQISRNSDDINADDILDDVYECHIISSVVGGSLVPNKDYREPTILKHLEKVEDVEDVDGDIVDGLNLRLQLAIGDKNRYRNKLNKAKAREVKIKQEHKDEVDALLLTIDGYKQQITNLAITLGNNKATIDNLNKFNEKKTKELNELREVHTTNEAEDKFISSMPTDDIKRIWLVEPLKNRKSRKRVILWSQNRKPKKRKWWQW